MAGVAPGVPLGVDVGGPMVDVGDGIGVREGTAVSVATAVGVGVAIFGIAVGAADRDALVGMAAAAPGD